ncbi:hypothetical protein BT96DRAFT_1059858 [Gymnopus androsaceus JB14]|uniref:Uncharacterized protein n=1 Tax=Gymnopus androsaceus JB14 TaxID=1447944 RepID=A0A6A4H211_9AGAR|nr:hypothetical protein BT96DRAFT_1059858 [Gymnopus androsaceus JB14]
MLTIVNPLSQAYFDHTCPRFCPLVCANVLWLFYLNDQGYKMTSTLELLCHILCTCVYEFNTHYCYSSDWLFYYLRDLCGRCSNPELSELRHLLEMRQ